MTDSERKKELSRVIELTRQGRLDILAIPFLVEEIARRDAALKTACEWNENTCPINEMSLTGAYPEWCLFEADGDGEPRSCRHWQGSYECWLEYYMGRMNEMK
jgi:hypothetical protein